MKKNSLLSIVLCVSVTFSVTFSGLFFVNVQPARAYTVFDLGNFIPNLGDWGTNLGQLATTIAKWVADKALKIAQILAGMGVIAAKIIALLGVQALTNSMMSGGSSGYVITDYKNYLYVAPQQRAMAQMDKFFIATSKGRLSSANYEGIGPNYDAYLVNQTKKAIAGQAFVTNIQSQVTDPSKEMFSGGNMKGIMSYMQCANNVACYTMAATQKYDTELTKAQTIAKNEQQGGLLPQKNLLTGKIMKPAALMSNALMQVDQLGTNLILQADPKAPEAAYAQIAGGAAISLISRTINYETANTTDRAALRTKNTQFPFSLSYTASGGASIK
jgi:hypothetical protein